MNKYKKDPMNADSDEMNSLVFKKFCFLHDVDEIEEESNNQLENSDNKVFDESYELVKMLRFKLVVSDWYLNENQLGRLK